MNGKTSVFLHTKKTGKCFKQTINQIPSMFSQNPSIPTKKKEKRHISNHNSERPNQAILLMITNGKIWHCLVVKSLSRLLQKITSYRNGDYYQMNCLYSFRGKDKLKLQEKVCKYDDYCYMTMPEEDKNILKYNQDKKIFEDSIPYLCGHRIAAWKNSRRS